MYLQIDTTQGRTDVREPDDLKHFSVRVAEQLDLESLTRALGSLGYFDTPEQAWIDIRELRRTIGRDDDQEWSMQFDAMLEYAASKGWVNEQGTALSAHLDVGGDSR